MNGKRMLLSSVFLMHIVGLIGSDDYAPLGQLPSTGQTSCLSRLCCRRQGRYCVAPDGQTRLWNTPQVRKCIGVFILASCGTALGLTCYFSKDCGPSTWML